MSANPRSRSASRLRRRAPSSSDGRLAHGREAPVVDELLPAVRAQVGLGVPDVDDEQHEAGLSAIRRSSVDASVVQVERAAPGRATAGWFPSVHGRGPQAKRRRRRGAAGIGGVGDKLATVTYVLHAIPASHPCAAVERALQLKGLPYRRVELIPVAHKAQQRAALRRDDRARPRVPGRAAADRLARDPARARGPPAVAGARRPRGAAARGAGGGVGRPGAAAAGPPRRLGRGLPPPRGDGRLLGGRRPARPARGGAAERAARLARRPRRQRRLRPQRARRPRPPRAPPRPRGPLDRGAARWAARSPTPPTSRWAPAWRCSPPSRTSRPSSRTGPRSPSRGAGSPATRRGACPRGRCPPSGSASPRPRARGRPGPRHGQRDRRRPREP